MGGAVNSAQLIPALRDLYSRNPEYRHLQPWELQWLLYALNYTDELENESEIAAAVEVARGDYPQWRPAA
jgi:hypothetical protein